MILTSTTVIALSKTTISSDNLSKSILVDISFKKPSLEIQTKENNYTYCYHIDSLTYTKTYEDLTLPVYPMQILLPYNTNLDHITITSDTCYQLLNPATITDPSHLLTSLLTRGSEQTEEATFPSYSLVGTYSLHGYQILYLNVYPVDVGSTTSYLSYYPEMSINITTKPSSQHHPLRATSSDIQKTRDIVDNPETLSSYPTMQTVSTDDTISYIIITNESFAHSPLEDSFEYLISNKEQQGLTAAIFTVEDIISNPDYSVNGTWGDNNPENPFYNPRQTITQNFSRFDDTAARIRNFIRYAYMELGTDYVLLGGDADTSNEKENIIPVRGLFANESGLPLISTPLGSSVGEEEDDIPSDLYYACLDGTFNDDMDSHFGETSNRNERNSYDEADLLAEVAVGRACVDNYQEIAHFVSKTVHYQNSPDEPYLKKVLFIGEYLGFPGISAYGGNYKDLVIPYIPDDYSLDTLYDRDLPNDWGKEDIIQIINQATPHIINHDGHSNYGTNLNLRITDVDQLQNIDPFFLYSHGCNAGGFDNPSGYDCIAEHYTVESPHAAVAVIMNARYGLGSEDNLDSPSLALDISFFKALYNESIRELGPANHYSKEDHIWEIDENGIRWVIYETNLLGDPALRIHDPSDIQFTVNVSLSTPRSDGSIYLLNHQLFALPFLLKPLIIGSLDVIVEASTQPSGYIYNVEFIVDDVIYSYDYEAPYEWHMDLPLHGQHALTITAYTRYGDSKTRSQSFIGFARGN
jgi:hypothetical protein